MVVKGGAPSSEVVYPAQGVEMQYLLLVSRRWRGPDLDHTRSDSDLIVTATAFVRSAAMLGLTFRPLVLFAIA